MVLFNATVPLLCDALLAEGDEAILTGHSTVNVGGLDNIVVGSWPDLHDAHRYKPSVLNSKQYTIT